MNNDCEDEILEALGRAPEVVEHVVEGVPHLPDLGDLAEAGYRGGAHIVVNAAGDRHVEMLLDQSRRRRVDRSHGRRACSVRNEIRAMEIESIRDTAGDAVG